MIRPDAAKVRRCLIKFVEVAQRPAPVDDLRQHSAVDALDLQRGRAPFKFLDGLPSSEIALRPRRRGSPRLRRSSHHVPPSEPPRSSRSPQRRLDRAGHPRLGAGGDPAPVVQVRVALLEVLVGRHVARPGLAVAHRHDEGVGAGPLGQQLVLNVRLAGQKQEPPPIRACPRGGVTSAEKVASRNGASVEAAATGPPARQAASVPRASRRLTRRAGLNGRGSVLLRRSPLAPQGRS